MLPATLQILSDLVSRLAERELVPRFHCQDGNRKADGSLVTEADIVMQTALIAELNVPSKNSKLRMGELTCKRIRIQIFTSSSDILICNTQTMTP